MTHILIDAPFSTCQTCKRYLSAQLPTMSAGGVMKLLEPQELQVAGQPRSGQTRAVGAVRIQLQSAHLEKEGGLRSFLPPPSPFVEISINDEFIGHSKQLHSTHDPYWFPQAFHALIHSSQDSIVLSVLSSRSSSWRTKLVGKASYRVSKLEAEPFHLAISEKLWKKDKERGSILFDVVLYKPTQVSSSEDDSTLGIVTLILYGAKDLSFGDIATSQLRPRVIVRTDIDEVGLQATPLGASGDPEWNSQCEILAMQGRRTRLVLEVKNGVYDLGHITLPLGDLLSGVGQNGRWWPLSGSPMGQLKLKAEYKALSIN